MVALTILSLNLLERSLFSPFPDLKLKIFPHLEANSNTSVTRDIISDLPGYLPTMVVGDMQQMPSTRTKSSLNLTSFVQASRLPNAHSTRARHPSSSATPTLSTNPWPSKARPRASSHTVQPTAPISFPPCSSIPDHNQKRSPTSETHANYESETESSQDQNGFPSDVSQEHASTPPSPRLHPQNRSVLSFTNSGAASPSRIRVRDLNHIQSFASEEVLTRSRHGSRHSLKARQEGGQQYEISSMPVTDIIEMVAGLLTKITMTNDHQHENLHRHIPPPEGSTGLSQQSTSVLAFHGKNVPSISILSYLGRIHKYCPTTYEVFLSLLVYFDRMTEMVNNGTLRSFRDKENTAQYERTVSGETSPNGSARDPKPSELSAKASPSSSDLVDSDDESDTRASPSTTPSLPSDADAYDISHFFVVDSFNIHRLVIAGVTCASKFFSDVFYTNSRYAKVSPIFLV